MNDFTIEELNFIWQRLAITDYSNFKDMQELPNKVCAMIKSHCDHDWENPCCGCPSSACFCTKCNRNVYE